MCRQATPESVERMEPFVMAPWRSLPSVSIPERDKAKEEARNISTPAVYTDASARNDLVGMGICWFGMDHARPPNTPSEQVLYTLAKADEMDIYTAELHAIWHALRQIHHLVVVEKYNLEIVVFSDSERAMRSLQSPGQQYGQYLIRNIIECTHLINDISMSAVRFQWCLGHANIPGNDLADKLVKEATKKGRTVDTYPIFSTPITLRSTAHQKVREIPPPVQVIKITVGKYTRAIDKALPGKHTRALYNGRSYKDVSILCQLRTGMCRLNGYLSKIKVVGTPLCDCGVAEEIIDHFLF